MDSGVKLRGGNLRAKRQEYQRSNEERIRKANENWNQYYGENNHHDDVHQQKVAFKVYPTIDDGARDFYAQIGTAETESDDSNFLSLGLDYSFLFSYFKDVEYIFLNQGFDLKNTKNVDNELPIVFSEHLIREEFLKRERDKKEGQRLLIDYLDDKNSFISKVEFLFLQYQLIWFNYFECIDDNCLSMGVFKDLRHNKILIVASSKKSESLKVCLETDLYKNDQYILYSSAYSEMFMRIFALWTGVFVETKQSLFCNKQIHAISTEFVNKILKEQVVIGHQFNKSSEEDFKQICKSLFGGDPLIDIYATNIHPSFINYFLNQISQKKLLIKASLQDTCNKDESMDTSLLCFVDCVNMITKMRDNENNGNNDVFYYDWIRKEKVGDRELVITFLLDRTQNSIQKNKRLKDQKKYKRAFICKDINEDETRRFNKEIPFSFETHELGKDSNCWKIDFQFRQYAPKLKINVYTLQQDLFPNSEIPLHSVFVDKNFDFCQGIDWTKMTHLVLKNFIEIPCDHQELILFANNVEKEARGEHGVHIFSLLNHEKSALFIILVVLQRIFDACQMAYKHGIQISREDFFSQIHFLHLFLQINNFQILNDDKLLLQELTSKLWHKLWQTYQQNQGFNSNLPYLDYPFSYSNYSLKEIETTYIHLQDIHTLHAETFQNIFVFTDEYFFGSYRDEQDICQVIHLPMRYWVNIDKKIEFDKSQVYFFKMANLLKRVNDKKDLTSLYYPLLVRMHLQQEISYFYLFDCIYLYIKEAVWKLRDKINFSECGYKLKICTREAFDAEFSLCYQLYGYSLLDTLEKLKVNIYPLIEKHPDFPNFFNEKFYRENLEQKVTHEDWKNQFLILVDGKPLDNRKKQNGELKNTSLKQINEERMYLRKKIYEMQSLKASDLRELKYVIDAHLRNGKMCVTKDKRRRRQVKES